MLTCDNISLVRQNIPIFASLGFTAAKQSCIKISGPNGSGKTSLLRIIARLIRNHGGVIRYNEIDVDSSLDYYYSQLLYISDFAAIDFALSVEENAIFWAKMYHTEANVYASLEVMGLLHKAKVIAASLSTGQKQRLGLAKLLLTNASLWLLDEPFAHLDLEGCKILANIINAKLDNGGIVLFTGHVAETYGIERYFNLDLTKFSVV